MITTLGFALGFSSLARSYTVQTVSGYSCHVLAAGNEADCGLGGGTWASTGISTVYVDVFAQWGGSMSIDLLRLSYTGTRTEAVVGRSFNAGANDLMLSTPAMATNPSMWDYHTIVLLSSPNTFTSQVDLYGVSAITN
jgi:hypothetical protein